MILARRIAATLTEIIEAWTEGCEKREFMQAFAQRAYLAARCSTPPKCLPIRICVSAARCSISSIRRAAPI